MKVESGKLDRRLIVSSSTITTNEYGEQTSTWTTIATIHGQRLELRQLDVARSAGRETHASARYLIRYRVGLAVGQRLIVDGETYQIVEIDEPDRRATLVLTVASV